jgi:acyl carrier protein
LLVDAAEIETVIVELLAAESGLSPSAQRVTLEQAGPGLPIDSLLLAEIVVVLEERIGIRVPEDNDTAKTMGSVAAFAAHLATVASPVGVR